MSRRGRSSRATACASALTLPGSLVRKNHTLFLVLLHGVHTAVSLPLAPLPRALCLWHKSYTQLYPPPSSLFRLFSLPRALCLCHKPHYPLPPPPSSLSLGSLHSLLCLPSLLPLYGRADSSTTRVLSLARLTWIMPEAGGAGILRETAFWPKRTSNCSTVPLPRRTSAIRTEKCPLRQ